MPGKLRTFWKKIFDILFRLQIDEILKYYINHIIITIISVYNNFLIDMKLFSHLRIFCYSIFYNFFFLFSIFLLLIYYFLIGFYEFWISSIVLLTEAVVWVEKVNLSWALFTFVYVSAIHTQIPTPHQQHSVWLEALHFIHKFIYFSLKFFFFFVNFVYHFVLKSIYTETKTHWQQIIKQYHKQTNHIYIYIYKNKTPGWAFILSALFISLII